MRNAAALLLTLLLVACGQDSAMEQAGEAVDDAGDEVTDAIEDAREEVEEAAD